MRETARMRRRDGDGALTTARKLRRAVLVAPFLMRRLPGAVFLAPLLLGVPACRSGPDEIQQVYQAADSADQLMIGLRMYVTNQGVRQALLESDTAFVYENTGLTELRGIKLTFYTTTGAQTSVLTSKQGTYRGRQGQMEAREDVVVVREDGARLTTSVLRYDQNRNEVSTDQAFVYDAPPDRHIEGEGFVSDPTFTNLTARRPRGTAGRFTLPGQ